jgi:NTE family protein
MAHIGVLKAFEEANIPIDFIAGTSVGAAIGAAYCSGVSAKELEEVACILKFSDFAALLSPATAFGTTIAWPTCCIAYSK